MRTKILTIIILLTTTITAQVGINTTTPNAQLDIQSSNQSNPSNTDGVLIPKIDLFPAINPTVAQQGMLVYLTTTISNNTPGFYYWNNTTTSWVPIKGVDGVTLDQAYDFGGAGAGRTITADAGAVHITGRDGFQVTGTYNQGASVEPVGSSPVMFFNPRKAAFRAGRSSGSQWQDDNVGFYSVAFGQNTTASGFNSTALGNENTASGYYSTVLGRQNNANSYGSTFIGTFSAIPSGQNETGFTETDYLFNIGNGTTNTNRRNAFTLLKNGFATLPSVTNALIDADITGKAVVTKEWVRERSSGTLDQAYDFGGAGAGRTITADAGAVRIDGRDGLQVTGTYNQGAFLNINGGGTRMFFYPRKAAFRAGYIVNNEWNDVNIGAYSMAWGFGSMASGSRSTAWGNRTQASATNTTAWGDRTYALATNATAFGLSTEASRDRATAWGNETRATGITATAFGFSTEASGSRATAWGIDSHAGGESATAFGWETQALGARSVAWGHQTVATAMGSTAFGFGNYAQTYLETVLGRHARISTGSTSSWVSSNRLFSIGNGTGDANRSNALTILKNGRMGLQDVFNPTYALHLPNNTTNGIGRAQANEWNTYSDGRLKTGRTILSYGLNEIMKIEPLSYFHHDSDIKEDGNIVVRESGKEQIGFIAQDMYKIIPEIVSVPEDETKELWGVSYDKLTPVLVKAIQEQQTLIENLQEEREHMYKLVSNLEARLNALENRSENYAKENE